MYTQAFKILLQKISSLLNQAEIDWLTDWHSWRKRVIKLDSSYVVLCSSPTKPLILRRIYSGNKNTQSRLTSQALKLSFSSLLCIHNMCVCVHGGLKLVEGDNVLLFFHLNLPPVTLNRHILTISHTNPHTVFLLPWHYKPLMSAGTLPTK